MESGHIKEDLRQTVTRLCKRVDEKWRQCSNAQRVDTSQNLVRDVFEQNDSELDLEKLYKLAQLLRGGLSDKGGKRSFRKWITDPHVSRAKILATILFPG